MWLSHVGVIVIGLIVEFSSTLASADANWSQTSVKYDALKPSENPLKTPTDTLNSPPEPLNPPSDALTSQTQALNSPPVVSFDGCRACQEQPETPGDSLTCHIISGIFTKDRLSVGSHVITTIPRNACRINITATAIAHGHLVLTTSTGDHILTGSRPMSHRRSAGTDFSFYVRSLSVSDGDTDVISHDEKRKEKEEEEEGQEDPPVSSAQYIVADGPLDQSISLRVVKELEHGATEILYTYTIPKRNESTVTYHRTRHNRNPRSASPVKRHNSTTIRPSKKRNPGKTRTTSRSVAHVVSRSTKLDRTSETKPEDDAQLQHDQPYLQIESEELGHGRGLGYRKRISNWNPYPAAPPEQFPSGLFYNPSSQGSYDPRRKLPEAYGSPPAKPLYAPNYPVPLPQHPQSPPRQSSFMLPDAIFSRPEMSFQAPEDGFLKPEVSLSQEDMGFDEPLQHLIKPEAHLLQPEEGSAQPEENKDDQNGYVPQAERGYRDQRSVSAFRSTGLDPRTQQQLPVGYPPSPGYTFYSAGPKPDLLEIPIYQRLESADPGIVYHAQFYRNSFHPDVAGHALSVYGPQPRWPQDPQPLLTRPDGFHDSRRSDRNIAPESRYVYQQQPPSPHPLAPAPAQPLTAGFRRPDLGQRRRFDAADDVNRLRDDDDDDDSYSWKIAGFTNCSRNCGGGVQSTMVVCVKMGVTPVRVTDENCGETPKPTTTNVTCNNRPCQPSWEADDWGQCSTSCNLGRQMRHVECRQRISSAALVTVTGARCQHEARPEVERECNADKPCYVWKTKEWSECSSVCGKGRRRREVTCAASDERPVDESKCVEGGRDSRPVTVEDCQMEACSKSWYHSRWPTQCSSDCGDGVHSRRVHCGADDKKCNEKTKPPTTKECRNQMPCGGTWFISSWTPCSASCGEGVKRRDVVCVKKLDKLTVIVSDENCIESDRASEEEGCFEGLCPPIWFTTDWSECSRTCNTGVQTREAKCLDDKESSSQSCDPLDKPELKQTCNVNACVPKLNRNNAQQQLVVSCRDQLKTCPVVVQARLCRYNFYKEACCFSCSSRGYGDDTVTSKSTNKS